ncbi:MAG: cyclase family protein [Janthinobacterium lividum]
MSAAPRFKHRPPGSNWGEFGPDDQRGRMNYVTAEKVLQGVAEVKAGRSFCLSLPLDLPGGNDLNPRRFPPVLRPTLRDGVPNFVCDNGASGHSDVFCDDLAVLYLQYSTQWDSFAHVGSLFDADGDGRRERVFYNGFRGGEHILGPTDAADAGVPNGPGRSTSRAGALGIENMAETCVQGRGVMIDLHAHFGRERKLVGFADLQRIMAADGVEVEKGDMVCLHTGFGQMLIDMGGTPDPHALHNACPVLDGRDHELLRWVTESGVSALIADNYAVEAAPAQPGGDDCAALPLHEHCLFKLGVHLGEIWHLTPLAAWLREHGRNRFLLTAPPLRLPGAVGSPVTPVATV